MRQKIDLLFQKMLKKVQERKFDFYDIGTLNQRLVIKFPVSIILNKIIIVQKNKIYNFINYL